MCRQPSERAGVANLAPHSANKKAALWKSMGHSTATWKHHRSTPFTPPSTTRQHCALVPTAVAFLARSLEFVSIRHETSSSWISSPILSLVEFPASRFQKFWLVTARGALGSWPFMGVVQFQIFLSLFLLLVPYTRVRGDSFLRPPALL